MHGLGGLHFLLACSLILTRSLTHSLTPLPQVWEDGQAKASSYEWIRPEGYVLPGVFQHSDYVYFSVALFSFILNIHYRYKNVIMRFVVFVLWFWCFDGAVMVHVWILRVDWLTSCIHSLPFCYIFGLLFHYTFGKDCRVGRTPRGADSEFTNVLLQSS